MLILSSTTELLRVVTGSAADIEVYTAWATFEPSTDATDVDDSILASITTATTTTIVPAPATGFRYNVQHINITNNHASQSCAVAIEITDGTNVVELMQFILLSGENMIFNEEGRWTHRDAQGAEYPPAGLGAYNGFPVSFMKSGTAPDATGYWYCTSKDGGFPGAWATGAPGVNGRITDGTVAADFGCIPIKNPATGANYLTEIQMASSVAHTHLLFDILWVNTGLVITTTTAQAFTVPTLPARDINGTTSGEGCMVGILCTAAVGLAAVASNATISYVNSAGVAGRTATLSAIVGSQAPATPVIGTIIWFNLQAGDKGVQAGSWSLTLGTSWVSGTISVFIARDIATIGTVQPNVNVSRFLANPGIRIYNGSCILHCILASAATTTFFSGELTIAEK